MENLNIFDMIVLALVTLLGLKGLFRGFIKEFFALVGLVGGVYIASRVASSVGDTINSVVPMSNENTILLVGFVASVAIIWVVALLLGKILAGVFSASGLGFLDRFAGFVFGASKVFLLFSIIAYALSEVKTINDKLEANLKDSIVFPLLVETGSTIIKLDRDGLTQNITSKVDEAVKTTKESIEDITSSVIEDKVKELKDKAVETIKESSDTK
jgi:membrane protein required for colicin V production